MRWGAEIKPFIVVGMVLSVVIGAWLTLGVVRIVDGSIGRVTVRKVEPFSLVDEPMAGTLAERFRPWLLFDSKEKWRPLNVDYMFDEGTQRFCVRQGRVAQCFTIHDAAEFDKLIAEKQSGSNSYLATPATLERALQAAAPRP